MIQREKILVNGVIEDREMLCRAVIAQAELGKIEIVTSCLSYAEVCRDRNRSRTEKDKIAAYFEHDYILPTPVDRQVGEAARVLMLSNFAGLKPPDAIHIASAAVANVREMHTFDEKLLNLHEKVARKDGTLLKIVKPNVPMPPAPLLETKQNG